MDLASPAVDDDADTRGCATPNARETQGVVGARGGGTIVTCGTEWLAEPGDVYRTNGAAPMTANIIKRS